MYFFCTCGQTKAGSGHSDCKEVGHRKKEDPAHQLPTITNQPHSPKVKTAMQAFPMWRSDDGVEKEKNINIKVPHSPLHTEMRGNSLQT